MTDNNLSHPTLLTTPYVPPWQTAPAPPTIDPSRTGFVTTDDQVKIWYGLSGLPLEQTTKPPVLFLHGGLANSNYFGHQIDGLGTQYSVISIDSRGHGRSFDGPAELTYERMTLDVIQVLDHLKVAKASIVGWSDGAVIALDLAMNFAQRVDRVFAFGASYSPDNVNPSVEGSPVIESYSSRMGEEYGALSPTPESFQAFMKKVMTMWNSLPQWDASSFARIPASLAPLIFIVAGEREEALKGDVPFTLREWVCCTQVVLSPCLTIPKDSTLSAYHSSWSQSLWVRFIGNLVDNRLTSCRFLQDPATFNVFLARVLAYH